MTHARTTLRHGSKVFTAILALAFLFSGTLTASADGTAANKLAVAGSRTQAFAPNAEIRVLDETMKVSSVRDLILQLTSECSIVNALSTGSDGVAGKTSDSDTSTGRVTMRIEIDGNEVPVSQDSGTDDGSVVFCDRTYSRTVTDKDGDGKIDQEDDYISTRTANAFNWVAFDAGEAYDNPANGNNIINIEVFAKFESSTTPATPCAVGSRSCSEAFIGNRTLVVENTNAQNEEVATTTDPSPAPAPGGCGLPTCLP